MGRYHGRTLLCREDLAKGLDSLAVRLETRLGDGPVTAVAILGGAIMFAADLLRRLPAGIILDFLRIQSYGDASSPERRPQADWMPHVENVRGRHVLLLDDILDTGRTMKEARRVLLDELGAARVTSVVLVDKPVRRAVAVEADDRVLVLEEDLFLVGYGLDFAGRYRNLPDLVALDVPDGVSFSASDLQLPG